MAQEGDAYRIVAPVELDFDIHKDKDKFRLVGHGADRAGAAVQPLPRAVPAAGGCAVRPAVPAGHRTGEGDEQEVEEEDLDTSYYRDDQIDLNELLREQFYLALPMKPLCREDCRGLCPQCGTNLNTGTCTCATEWEDPRLAALKGLVRDEA